MTFSCIVCGQSASSPWLDRCHDLYLGTAGLTDYVRCDTCGLVQQHPPPLDTTTLYQEYPVHRGRAGWVDRLRRVMFARAYLDVRSLPTGGALLDFGCGGGWYLESMKGRGFDLRGYEFHGAHAASLTSRLGLEVHSDWKALADSLGHPVDVVTLHYVMEHLLDPQGTLQRISDLLAPGGRVYVLLPNIHSWESRMFGRRWHGLDPPRHVSFPDRPVIERMARVVGLEVTSERPAPFPNTFTGSAAVALTGRFSTVLFCAFLPLGVVLSALFPSGSMAYELVKPL